MSDHLFIFKPGIWLGEGKILLNLVEEELKFFAKWQVQQGDFAHQIQAAQDMQISGIAEKMRNEFFFFEFGKDYFKVKMENANVGTITGKGVYDDKKVAWEFRNNELNFEGLEVYTLLKEDEYQMHAEYVTSDQFRTQMDGRIWLSTSAEHINQIKEGES